MERVAKKAEPTDAVLRERIRSEPTVRPDETGWKVGGQRGWRGAFSSPGMTVYADHQDRAPVGPHLREPHPEYAVCSTELDASLASSPKDIQLVAESEIFHLQGRPTLERVSKK